MTGNSHYDTRSHSTGRRVSTETKASVKTSELIAYVVAALGVLIASAVVDASDFGSQEAWFYVTLLTIDVSTLWPNAGVQGLARGVADLVFSPAA